MFSPHARRRPSWAFVRRWRSSGYTAAERTAAAVGGQTRPHTLAAAIVQVEARRRRAAKAAAAAAAVAGAPAATNAAASAAAAAIAAGGAAGGGGSAAAGGSASRLAASNAAPTGSTGVEAQPLPGRAVTGLSADALARVRAAVAAAGEGASPDEVARIASGTLQTVLGSFASHPDQPRLHGEQPALDYGDEL